MKHRVIPLIILVVISGTILPVNAYSMSWLHRELYFNNNSLSYAGGITVNWYAHDGYTIGMSGAASFDVQYRASNENYHVILNSVTFVLCEHNFAPYENGSLPNGHVYAKVSKSLNVRLSDYTYKSDRFVMDLSNNVSSTADLHIILEITVYFINSSWRTLIVSHSVERNIVYISQVPNLYDALIYFIEVIIIMGISGLIFAGIALLFVKRKVVIKSDE